MAKHGDLTSIHPAAFVGNTDPSLDADNNVQPDDLWIDTTSGPPFVLNVRNTANTTWQQVGSIPADLSAYVTKALLTTKGDLYVATESGVITRLAAGTNGKVLAANSAVAEGVEWVNQAGLANPMFIEDDIIVGGVDGVPTRLAKGSDGTVLTVDPTSHHLVWAAAAGGGGATNLNALTDVLIEFPDAGQILQYDGTVWYNYAWYESLNFVIGNGVDVITTGIKGDIRVENSYYIESWTLLADVSGSIVIDIWRDNYAAYPPVLADSITASDKPKIELATKATGGALTGWTRTLNVGDILRFNVDSIATIKRVTLGMKLRRLV